MRQTRTFARFTAVFGVAGESESSSDVLRAVQFDTEAPLLGHEAFELDDPTALYVLTSGEADLFYVRGDATSLHSARRYVGTMQPGDVVAGAAPSEATGGGVILAVGFGDARMALVPISAISDDMETGPRIARALANGLAESIGRSMYRATVAPALQVEARSSTQNFAQDTAITAGVEVLWFWTDGGELALGGEIPIHGDDCYFPLARGMWVTIASSAAELSVSDTMSMLDSGTVQQTISAAWTAFLAWTSAWFDREDEQQRERLDSRVNNDRIRHDRSIAGLASLLQTRDTSSSTAHSDDVWVTACALVCEAAHIPFRTPPHFECRAWRYSQC